MTMFKVMSDYIEKCEYCEIVDLLFNINQLERSNIIDQKQARRLNFEVAKRYELLTEKDSACITNLVVAFKSVYGGYAHSNVQNYVDTDNVKAISKVSFRELYPVCVEWCDPNTVKLNDVQEVNPVLNLCADLERDPKLYDEFKVYMANKFGRCL